MTLTVEDVSALHDLQREYAAYITAGDLARYLDLFAADAVWERVTPGVGTKYDQHVRLDGIEQIRRHTSERFPKPFEMGYVTVNPLVAGTGTEAEGSATLLVYEMRGGSPHLSVVVNAADRYRKQADGWRFTLRELRCLQ